MTKVYLVWSGEYSSKDVEGVFSTREAAEAFAAEVDKQDGSSYVEEKDLDGRAGERVLPQWTTFIGCESGATTAPEVRCSLPSRAFPEAGTYRVDHRIIWGFARKYPQISDSEPVICARSDVSADHALKLAVEKRQEWLRTRDLQPR
jgi:hypothetical protein